MIKKIGLLGAMIMLVIVATAMSQENYRYRFELPDIEGNFMMSDRWIGVTGRDVEQNDLPSFKLKELAGVIITEIKDKSPASKVDLRKDDVILDYDHQKIMSMKALRRMVDETPIGRQIVLLVSRQGGVREIKMNVEKRSWEFEVPPFKKIMRDWNNNEQPNCPRLGVEIQGLTPELRRFFGVSEEAGVLIARVEKDSSAEKNGLQVGDVIVKINQNAIREPDEVREQVCNTKSFDDLSITILRNKKEMVIHSSKAPGKLEKN